MSSRLPVLPKYVLSWPDVIDISANSGNPIEVIDTQLAHRVRVDVSASVIGPTLDWIRDGSDNAERPGGVWNVGDPTDDPASLFRVLADADKTDLDITVNADGEAILDFTTTNLDPFFAFSGGSANDIVIPYVLFRLFGKSSVSHGTVPNYTLLVDGEPLVSSIDWATAYTTSIEASPENVNVMFSELLQDVDRFKDNGVPVSALYSPEWTGDDVSGSTYEQGTVYATNPWRLRKGDIIQFATKFTFANEIRVKNISSINPDTPVSGDVPAKVISKGESFTIRFQLHVVDG